MTLNGKSRTKILLVNPPWKLAQTSVYSKTGAIYPPLGLASIAATTEQLPNVEVKILDAWGLGIGLDEFKTQLVQFQPDVLGITAYTATWSQAKAAAEAAKDVFEDVKVVMGGPHPSILPDEVILNNAVDFLIRGEGEYAFKRLVSELSSPSPNFSNIEGLTFIQDGAVVNNKGMGYVPDLNDLPTIDRHNLPMHVYRPASGAHKRTPVTSMITSRGCPFSCTCCSKAIFGSKVRFRSVPKVMEEIESLISYFGIKEIYFADDCFTLNKERARAICQEIIDRKLDLTWSCSTRVNLVDEPLLALMKEAGCISIGYGIETGNPEIAANIKKGITLEDAHRALKETRKIGIESRTSYIIGFPFEDRKSIYQTIRMAIVLNSDFVIFNIAIPLPGTQLYAEAKRHNLLLEDGEGLYDLTDGAHVTIRLPTLPPDELKKLYKQAYLIYYLRPAYILNRIRHINSIADIVNNLKGLFEFLLWQKAQK